MLLHLVEQRRRKRVQRKKERVWESDTCTGDFGFTTPVCCDLRAVSTFKCEYNSEYRYDKSEEEGREKVHLLVSFSPMSCTQWASISISNRFYYNGPISISTPKKASQVGSIRYLKENDWVHLVPICKLRRYASSSSKFEVYILN